MRQIFQDFAWNVYLTLYSFYGRQILKCQAKHMGAVFFKTYLCTFSLFPEHKLKVNSDIASAVQCRFFNVPLSQEAAKVEESNVQTLYDTIKSEEWTKKAISRYFLLEAFYYSYGITSDSLKEKSESALEKAKLYDQTATAISFDDVGPINNAIKADIKTLKREMRKLNSEKVEKEKFKALKPIEINSSHIMFAISLFSTLFLVSGFAYNKLFFSCFGISVADFFSITDYLASSVDVIVATLISSALGMAFFFWGISIGLSEKIHVEQFETEIKGEDYVIPAIILVSSIGLVFFSYRDGELHSLYLFPLVIYIILHIFVRLPIWRYVENRVPVAAVLISVIYFSFHLGLSVKDKVEDIMDGKYKSPYEIEYGKMYTGSLGNDFISANSTYIFMWNKNKQKMQVISKSEVSSFHGRIINN